MERWRGPGSSVTKVGPHLSAVCQWTRTEEGPQILHHAFTAEFAVLVFAVKLRLSAGAVIDSHATQSEAIRCAGAVLRLGNCPQPLALRHAIGICPSAHFQVENARIAEPEKKNK